MRKVTGLVLAAGLVVAFVVGCGQQTKTSMVEKLQSEAQTLETQNYKSQATMTVQMDNSSQTYYIETWYESPDTYRISLGDGNKNINQIIVHNKNGMFIVSPSLQKVFRFNGNWAQNQGHIYLYDQILKQIVSGGSDVKMSKSGQTYTFQMPVAPASDVVSKQQVEINATDLTPKQVVLYDKQDKAVVTIVFQKFQTGVQFQNAAFDPQQLATNGNAAKTTLAQDSQFNYVEPGNTLGDKLSIAFPVERTDELLRYAGMHGFTLDESQPMMGVDAIPNAELVDLYGVPALYVGSADSHSHQLIWLNNGIEYNMASADLNLNQMKTVALSTFAMTGK